MFIAITGASGHVGSNLCRMLLARGHKVRALALNDFRSLEGLDLEAMKGSVLDEELVRKFVTGVDAVVHLAAIISIRGRDDGSVRAVNVEGTRNVLEAVKTAKVPKLIHFSSIHALDNSPIEEPMDESKDLVSASPLPYETTKSAAESLVRKSIEQGLNAIIMNPTSIVGPNDFKPSLMGQVIIKLYKRQIPALVDGGYNWVDVRDICEATIAALEKNTKHRRYILSGKWNDLKSLSKLLAETTGKSTPQTVLPIWMARIGVPFMGMWAAIKHESPLYTNPTLDIIKAGNRKINNQRAQEDLGFNPRPLRETVSDTVQWFRENNYL